MSIGLSLRNYCMGIAMMDPVQSEVNARLHRHSLIKFKARLP